MIHKTLLSTVLLTISLLSFLPVLAQEPEKTGTGPQASLRVYFVGNSVTDTINYRGLEALAKSRGHEHAWGRHMIPGAPLQWIWQHPDQGFQEQPYGHYPTALTKFQWDALCLQPFDRHIKGEHGDVEMARNFIKLALSKSPDVQVYVYARWPRTHVDGKPFSWGKSASTSLPTPAVGKPKLFNGFDEWGSLWLRKYTGGWDGTNETKDYFERLMLELRKACPELKKPVLMVPVGHVMYKLDQQMKAGQVPGYKNVWDVYKDGIHLNNVGSYIVACTFFATLYRQNPMGLTTEPYGVIDSKLAEVIQDVVWRVVTTHDLAGLANATSAGTMTSMKGWELYIWQEGGDTYFSLMIGTNRLKSDEEIVQAAAKGLDAIKLKLDELKPGEMVFPCGRRMSEQAPDEPATEIGNYCQKLGLNVDR